MPNSRCPISRFRKLSRSGAKRVEISIVIQAFTVKSLLLFALLSPVAFAAPATPAKAPKAAAPAAAATASDARATAGGAATSSATLDGAALAAASHGWIDLLRGASFSEWQRCPLPAGSTLEARNPWQLNASTAILRCEASGLHEYFLHGTERGDGIFRVEWRYAGDPGKPKAGIVVRARPDGSVLFRADLDPNNAGMLYGTTPAGPGGKVIRSTSGKRRPDLLKKSGEWNVTELVCLGPRVLLHLNGTATAELRDASVSRGLIGLEADDAPIEFRQVRFKPLP
jgi:hypothetical protein